MGDKTTERLIAERLGPWGWSRRLARAHAASSSPELPPARVIAQHRGGYRLASPLGELVGVAPGRMRYRATARREMPAVGDWVLVEPPADGPATIVEILPRSSQFVRRKAGTESEEQVVAANIDVAFLMTSLNLELNPRRLERYLVASRDGGVEPVVVLTKLDLVEDAGAARELLAELAGDAPILAVSALDGTGLDALRVYLEPGRTVVLLGSSGVGKSTLVNVLSGREVLETREIRDIDDKGRHTTTHREIFQLPGGALVLDTPGMRELGLVEAEEGLDETFDDVAALAGECRFRDCTHRAEPGCAVRAALEAGELEPSRLESYDKLQREAAHEERRRDPAAALAQKKRWKAIHKQYRKDFKNK